MFWTTLGYFILGVYVVALFIITAYCLLSFHLLWKYRYGKNNPILPIASAQKKWPLVTVQLPVFNELYVVERLIDCIAQLDYPRACLEIQVLDDSTDESRSVAAAKVAEWKAQGLDIVHIHRTDRSGFKAGALQEGLAKAKGEFIAIFDADFLPNPDFLLRTLPAFEDPALGVVQTRWEHINEEYSILTRLQALQLNVHFSVEQKGRQRGNYLLQFNGTAGVWRKQTISEAGGWKADTLTEDLDLSIRAQLKNWKIAFLEQVGAPAELPAEMNGIKSQQFRWNKGGAETARKMLPSIWRSALPFSTKLHATGHLLSSGVFLAVFITGVFSVPLLWALVELQIPSAYFSFFLIGLLSMLAVYFQANVGAHHHAGNRAQRLFKFIFLFPLFLALSMGLSLHNTIAVLQGYIGKKSAFVRTPKFNLQSFGDSWRKKKYTKSRLSWTTIFEGMLALYFLAALVLGWHFELYTFWLFHLLLFVGYSGIFYYTISHLRTK